MDERSAVERRALADVALHHQLIDDYVQAARRAKEAGFDLVEIHAAHGYMGGQFLSGRSNKRIDEFGGSIEGRTTFLRLIREGIAEVCGQDYPVIVRLSSQEDRSGGVEPNEALVQAMLLEAAGYDAIHVSAGTYGSWDTIVPPPDWQRAWNVESTQRLKAAVGVPVISVGRFNEPHLVEMAIVNGAADMVALGRPSIADPAFPNKMQAGELLDIVPCISCTQRCMTFNDPSTLNEGDWGVSCMFNPWSNNRAEMRVSPAAAPKKVMVVGAGPAGLQAAHVAAGRGHHVTVFDRGPASRAGGQFLIAAYPPFKQELTRAIRYQLHRCEATGVEFRWHTEVTREVVEDFAPDVLVMATGSVPLKPGIPGIDGPRVVSATDVLTGTQVAGRVLVVGAGETGTETAEYCTDYCDHVTLVDRIPAIAPHLYLTVRDSLLRRFRTLPIEVHTNTEVRAFLDDGVAVRTPTGEQVLSGFDHIILTMGTRPAPAFDTEGLDCEVHVVGDAKAARDAVAAIWEGTRVAMAV